MYTTKKCLLLIATLGINASCECFKEPQTYLHCLCPRRMMNGDVYPRKKARTRSRSTSRERERYTSLSQLLSDPNHTPNPAARWWDASISTTLLANGLPRLTYSSSYDCEARYQPHPLPQSVVIQAPRPAKKRRKRRPPENGARQPRSLLCLVNNNIRTLRRVRRTHDKFLALNLSSEEGAGAGSGSVEPPEPRILNNIVGPGVADDDADVDVNFDERPWRTRGTELEIGERDADDCLHWMGTKVLEHAGFQSEQNKTSTPSMIS